MICTARQITVYRDDQIMTDGTGYVAYKRERRGTYSALVGKPEGNRLLGGHRHRWEDNVKQILRKSIGTACIGLFWLGKGTRGGLL